MTRRLDGYRGLAAGVLLYLVAFAALSPFVLAGTPARAAFREISIVDDEFEPSEIVVERGDTVVWVHRGARPHGVRATDGSFDSSPGCSFQNGGACMRSGDRYSRTFDEPGTFTYYCPVHGKASGVGMAGHVTVPSGSGDPDPTTTTAPPPATTTTSRPAGTTMRPPPTAASTTESPGGSTTTAAAGAPAPSTEPAPSGPDTTLITVPSQNAGETSTSLAAGVPINGDSDDDGSGLLIGVAAAVLLAAAVSMGAWYYRPGARPPGAPPPPATPA